CEGHADRHHDQTAPRRGEGRAARRRQPHPAQGHPPVVHPRTRSGSRPGPAGGTRAARAALRRGRGALRRRAAHRAGPARRLARGSVPRYPDCAVRSADGGSRPARADASGSPPVRCRARRSGPGRPADPRPDPSRNRPVPVVPPGTPRDSGIGATGTLGSRVSVWSSIVSRVSIETRGACVDFPIFDAKTRSLKKAFLGKAGGAIGRNNSDVVVVEALRDITMSRKEGDRVGLVGHNGAGKSTLLRLLSGIYEPTRGHAQVKGRVAPVFDLGVGMDPEISGYENIIIRGMFLGMSRKQMLAKVDEIADFTELGDYLNMPLRTYSTGMRVRVALG